MCGGDALQFHVNIGGLAYFELGVSSAWQPLTGQTALAGAPSVSFAGKIYTGDGNANNGWIMSANDSSTYTTHTFASSYNSVSSGWDYCNGVDYNGVTTVTPMVYLLYR
jgi:hypothetical protein